MNIEELKELRRQLHATKSEKYIPLNLYNNGDYDYDSPESEFDHQFKNLPKAMTEKEYASLDKTDEMIKGVEDIFEAIVKKDNGGEFYDALLLNMNFNLLIKENFAKELAKSYLTGGYEKMHKTIIETGIDYNVCDKYVEMILENSCFIISDIVFHRDVGEDITKGLYIDGKLFKDEVKRIINFPKFIQRMNELGYSLYFRCYRIIDGGNTSSYKKIENYEDYICLVDRCCEDIYDFGGDDRFQLVAEFRKGAYEDEIKDERNYYTRVRKKDSNE